MRDYESLKEWFKNNPIEVVKLEPTTYLFKYEFGSSKLNSSEVVLWYNMYPEFMVECRANGDFTYNVVKSNKCTPEGNNQCLKFDTK